MLLSEITPTTYEITHIWELVGFTLIALCSNIIKCYLSSDTPSDTEIIAIDHIINDFVYLLSRLSDKIVVTCLDNLDGVNSVIRYNNCIDLYHQSKEILESYELLNERIKTITYNTEMQEILTRFPIHIERMDTVIDKLKSAIVCLNHAIYEQYPAFEHLFNIWLP